MNPIAVNVLMDPDAETVDRARAVNARLLSASISSATMA